MRVLISVDMEGVAGVVAPEDISPGNPEYERNRGYMTDEASAAVRGVLSAQPDASVVVCDAHAMFRNLLPDRLDRRCTLLRGSPRMHGMLTGIDGGVDAVCFVGYHGRAGTARSVLAHTISGSTIACVRCDGRELGELGLNAALASHHGAVAVLATGDDTLCAEAEAVVPGITTVEVKRVVTVRPRACTPRRRIHGSRRRRRRRCGIPWRFRARSSTEPSTSRSTCFGRTC
jgi:D-amino peptidase